ncbi:type II toxin-antitoxin system VapC family toxin [Desulfococcaceae bacterium HSG9]|nr:type II toxin-antitoxin system VapC family toxin [Desulfococcaceae bacterium HSG9]
MKLLLDTHVFLWLRSEPNRVSSRVLSGYQEPSNRIYLSIVSIWEMQIKHQIGKLRLDMPLKDIIEGQCDANTLEIMPLRLNHIFGLQNLPPHHKDPFDRLLIVQSRAESVSLVSSDRMFRQYGVTLFW